MSTLPSRSPAGAAAEPIVDLSSVRKSFGSGDLAFHALKGVDLQVMPGELLMLVGPSGSGKTTLLSILGCVLRPSAGRVSLFGEPLERAGDDTLTAVRRALIGFVFQGYNLIASLSARDNVAHSLLMRGHSRAAARREAEHMLERVGLADTMRKKPSQLSGGQQQRVGIARALAGNPPLLLADEPTAALDAASGHTVMELMSSLSREHGTTCVVVTHDSRTFSFAQRIVHLEDGLITRPHQGAAS
ncbi:ABC transporter ATP-binding protein [Haliangium sp.]|uniref:ABC transporter ATP-binding protein n=1 Tax=Haliangium sp. TaxID=2663208 RepID=UPI003D13E247